MTSYTCWIVDAFSDTPLKGNGCGVIFGADALSTQQMQSVAQELNQSETVFFQSPTDEDADYSIRIFTPSQELPFAGHPTLSAAHAFLESQEDSQRSRLTQQCGIGLVPLTIENNGQTCHITMQQRPPVISAVDSQADLVRDVFVDTDTPLIGPAIVSNTGIPWTVIEVAADMLTGPINYNGLRALSEAINSTDIAFYARTETEEPFIKVRTFFEVSNSFREDPVTGSAQGCIAGALWHHGQIPNGDTFRYTATQGTEIGRHGTVSVVIENTGDVSPDIFVGGSAVTTFKGEIFV